MTERGEHMKKLSKLKAAIFKKGLSQKGLAPMVGISEGWLSLIINGRVNPTQEEMSKIAAVLETKQEILFGE